MNIFFIKNNKLSANISLKTISNQILYWWKTTKKNHKILNLNKNNYKYLLTTCTFKIYYLFSIC